MYLSTEWECRTGKYLARGQDPYLLTDGQIFSRPVRPNSVNKHFIIRPLCVFFFYFSDEANPHQSIRVSNRAARVFSALPLDAYGPHGGLFVIWFPTKLRAGLYLS